MSQVALHLRLVEVIADLGSGQKRYGSGCIVTGRNVLTAAHVVADAQAVSVRDTRKRTLPCRPLDVTFVGHPTALSRGPDLALLEIDDTSVDLPPMALAQVDRESPSGEPVERCHVWGYPQSAEAYPDGPDGEPMRDTLWAAGTVPVGSKLASGLLDIQLPVAPRDLPPLDQSLEDSPWKGISGGPVIASGLLLGVISEHAPRAGAGSLTATPLSAINPRARHPDWGPGVADPAAWWAKLGVPGPEALKVLPERSAPPYWATLRSMGRAYGDRMHRLRGRDEELKAISSFAQSAQGYRWLVGGAFAGKTALMYHAVTATLPHSVDVVAYFLRRAGSDADSNKFLAAVIPQLAALLGQEQIAGFDEHTYRSLWERAVTRARETDRHLLMVVDGLDEDLQPPHTASVASLLPDLVAGTDASAAHAHVHVTSRPRPNLPADLADYTGHPLHHTRTVRLTGFPGWEDLRDLGASEIDQLVDASGLPRDVLGLLAAASGPLSSADLAHLHTALSRDDVDEYDIEQVLTDLAARSLERVGPADDVRYEFAHATLLDHARSHKALAKPSYRNRIHAWADTWQRAGWPGPCNNGSGTPRYLLDTYPDTLTDDAERLVELVGDVGWVDASIRSTGVDQTVATLRTTAEAQEDRRVADLLATVSAQVRNLRTFRFGEDGPYVLRQLCLQALRFGMGDLANAARIRLESMSDAGPIPRWTTMRAVPPRLELGAHDRGILAIAVLADGRVVTSGDDGKVRVWRLSKPGQVTELIRGMRVAALAGLSNGSIVLGLLNGQVLLCHPASPDRRTEMGTYDMPWVTAVAALADGRFVTGGYRRVLLWHPDHPGQLTEVGRHYSHVSAVVALPDGRIFTGGVDGRILLWNAEHPGRATELGSHDGDVSAMAASPDGRIFTGGVDGRILLWNAEHPGRATELGSHDSPVSSMAALSGGGICTGGMDGRILLWNAEHPGQATELGSHDGDVSAMAALPDGRLITGGGDGRVRLWNADHITGLEVRNKVAYQVASLPDGRIVTSGCGGRIRVWNAEHPGQATELGSYDGDVSAMAAFPDGRVITGGHDGRILIWHPRHPGRSTEVGRQDSRVSSMAVLPDGRIVTGGFNGSVRVWLPGHVGQPTEEFTHHNPPSAHRYVIYESGVMVAALPDGRIVTARRDHGVLVWHSDRHKDPTKVKVPDRWGVTAVAVLPDGRIVAFGDGGGFVWDMDDPDRPIRLGSDLIGGVNAVAALPNGHVVTSGDDRIMIWDTDQPDRPRAEITTSGGELAISTAPSSGLGLAVANGGLSWWTVSALPG